MHTITMFFSQAEELTLEQFQYICPRTRRTRRCVRGNQQTQDSDGSFTWSAGVKALCILLLQHRLDKTLGTEGKAAVPYFSEQGLSGEAGSFASTLDYALSKQPNWLHQLFGTREDGTSQARYLFQRTNPERKRAGPVTVSLSHNVLSGDNIQIALNGRLLADSKEVLECWKALIGDGTPKVVSHARNEDNSGEVSQKSLLETLQQAYFKEASDMLWETDIFSPKSFKRIKELATTHPLFKKLAGKSSRILTEIDQELCSGERLGVSLDANALAKLRDGASIRVAFSPAHVGTQLIFLYMRDELKLPIEINFGLAHTVELARRMINGNTPSALDICSLTASTAGTVLGIDRKIAFKPFMFMPAMSHGILAPSTSSGDDQILVKQGEYLLMAEVPSTEAFIFSDLLSSRSTREKFRMKVTEAEPDEVALALSGSDKNLRAIIGFPYYVVNSEFNDCRIITPPDEVSLRRETLLFASQDFLEHAERSRLLKVLVRDVWLRLREEPDTIGLLVQRLLSNQEYFISLGRCLGLSYMTKSQKLFEKPQVKVANG